MDVGFIGLGQMGTELARRLLKNGDRVIAFNRTREKAEALARAGAEIADTPRDAAKAGIVFTMLANDHALSEVVEGSDGVLAGLPSGGILVNTSTVSLAMTRRLVAAHKAGKASYVAAPVFGRPAAVAEGKLFIAVAGPAGAVDHIRPLLEAMSQKLFSFGDNPAQAAVVKISSNFMLQAAIEAMAEAFALVRGHGIDPEAYLDFFTSTTLKGPVYEGYGRAIVDGRYEPAGFPIPLALKDTRLAIESADEVSAPLPLADLIRDRFLIALSRGWEHLDQAALGKLAAENAGLGDA